jgi:hypothetical protein
MKNDYDPFFIKGVPFVSWLCGTLAVILCVIAGWLNFEATQLKGYASVEGTIHEIKIEYRERTWWELIGNFLTSTKASDKKHEYAHVFYEVNGQPFHLQKSTATFDSIGRKVTVLYNPKNPSKASTSTYESEVNLSYIVLKIGILILIIAIILETRVWWIYKKKNG